MLTNLLDITPPAEQTSPLPTIASFFVIIAAIIMMVYFLISSATPFHVSGINDNQREIAEEEKKQTKIAQETLDVEKQRLQLEEQRLQIEIEKLNLVRAKQNLPPYTPKSIDSKPTTTPEPEQEKPAV